MSELSLHAGLVQGGKRQQSQLKYMQRLSLSLVDNRQATTSWISPYALAIAWSRDVDVSIPIKIRAATPQQPLIRLERDSSTKCTSKIPGLADQAGGHHKYRQHLLSHNAVVPRHDAR